jgi:hypothetical protein
LPHTPAVLQSVLAKRVLTRSCLAGVVGGVAILAAACGSTTSTLDTAPIAHAIEQSILKQRGIATVVQCPASAPLKNGYRFRCSAALDVGSYALNVVELNAKGSVSYSNSTPLQTLDPHIVVLAIQGAIRSAKQPRPTVSCPKSILEAKGLTFTCTATTNSGTTSFSVIEVDGAGRVRLKKL